MGQQGYIEDIGSEEAAAFKLSPEDIAVITDEQLSFSDSETTGLNRERNGFTEFASVKAVREKPGQAPKLKLFQAIIIPFKPFYQEYLKACEEARAKGEPEPPYERKLYEYEVDPKALEVTGVRFERKNPEGPITRMLVGGKEVWSAAKGGNARPFYEVAEELKAFLCPQDLYYNAPFDKPFLLRQLRDVQAYRHMLADGELIRREGTSPLPYAELTLEEKARRYESLRARVELDPEWQERLGNPAQHQCLLHMYFHEKGFGPSNRLDDAYRNLRDNAFGQRGDHTAKEDILMSASVGMALREHLHGLPTIGELFQQVVQQPDVDPAAKVTLQPPRASGNQLVRGDIAIDFSRPYEKMTPHGKELFDFFESLSLANERNSRAPRHIESIQPDDVHKPSGRMPASVVLNAERKDPLILPLLRKTILFEKLRQIPGFVQIRPHDSSMEVDIVIRNAATGQVETVKDVHLASVRANMEFFKNHPEDLKGYLEIIHDVRHLSRKVGLCLFREDKNGIRVIVRGHQRAMGDVTLRFSPGTPLPRHKGEIMQSVTSLLSLGLLPAIEGTEAGEDEEQHEQEEELGEDVEDAAQSPRTPRASEADEFYEIPLDDQARASLTGTAGRPLHTIVDEEKDACRVILPPEIFDIVARQYGVSPRYRKDGIWHIDHLGDIEVRHETRVDEKSGQLKARYVLEGSLADYRTIQKTDVIPKGMKEKPFVKVGALVKDITWLKYRLERIPGTTDIAVRGKMVELKQKPWILPETLEVLYYAGLQYKATSTGVKLDFDQLIAHSFEVSLKLGEAAKKLREREQYDLPVPAPVLKCYQALVRGKVSSVEQSENKASPNLWLIHGGKDAMHPEGRHHLVEPHQEELGSYEPSHPFGNIVLNGPEHYYTKLQEDGSRVIAFGSDAFQQIFMSALEYQPGITGVYHQSSSRSLVIPGSEWEEAKRVLDAASIVLKGLGESNGLNRMEIRDIQYVADKDVPPVLSLTMSKSVALLDPILKSHIEELTETLPVTGTLGAHASGLIGAGEKDAQTSASRLQTFAWRHRRTADASAFARPVIKVYPAIDAMMRHIYNIMPGAQSQGARARAEEDALPPPSLDAELKNLLQAERARLGQLMHEVTLSLNGRTAKNPLPSVRKLKTSLDRLSSSLEGIDLSVLSVVKAVGQEAHKTSLHGAVHEGFEALLFDKLRTLATLPTGDHIPGRPVTKAVRAELEQDCHALMQEAYPENQKFYALAIELYKTEWFAPNRKKLLPGDRQRMIDYLQAFYLELEEKGLAQEDDTLPEEKRSAAAAKKLKAYAERIDAMVDQYLQAKGLLAPGEAQKQYAEANIREAFMARAVDYARYHKFQEAYETSDPAILELARHAFAKASGSPKDKAAFESFMAGISTPRRPLSKLLKDSVEARTTFHFSPSSHLASLKKYIDVGENEALARDKLHKQYDTRVDDVAIGRFHTIGANRHLIRRTQRVKDSLEALLNSMNHTYGLLTEIQTILRVDPEKIFSEDESQETVRRVDAATREMMGSFRQAQAQIYEGGTSRSFTLLSAIDETLPETLKINPRRVPEEFDLPESAEHIVIDAGPICRDIFRFADLFSKVRQVNETVETTFSPEEHRPLTPLSRDAWEVARETLEKNDWSARGIVLTETSHADKITAQLQIPAAQWESFRHDFPSLAAWHNAAEKVTGEVELTVPVQKIYEPLNLMAPRTPQEQAQEHLIGLMQQVAQCFSGKVIAGQRRIAVRIPDELLHELERHKEGFQALAQAQHLTLKHTPPMIETTWQDFNKLRFPLLGVLADTDWYPRAGEAASPMLRFTEITGELARQPYAEDGTTKYPSILEQTLADLVAKGVLTAMPKVTVEQKLGQVPKAEIEMTETQYHELALLMTRSGIEPVRSYLRSA